MTRSMKIEIHLDADRDEYIRATESFRGGFLQSPQWGDFKSRHGWEPGYSVFSAGGRTLGGGLYLRRELPLGQHFIYFPKGPLMDYKDISLCGEIISSLGRAFGGMRDKPLFVRVEPDIPQDGFYVRSIRKNGYKKAPYDIQYRHTRKLALPGEEELWKSFTSKQRNKIRTAGKKEVGIFKLDEADLDKWYDIYVETARRNNIFIHPRKYYADFFRTFSDAGLLSVFGAEYNGELLAASFIIHYNGESIYMFSGSGNKERKRRPNESIQWEALKESMEKGSSEYDMWGVSPPDSTGHPWKGLSEFKAGFGGRVVSYCGCYDYPVKGLLYGGFIAAEQTRKALLNLKKTVRR